MNLRYQLISIANFYFIISSTFLFRVFFCWLHNTQHSEWERGRKRKKRKWQPKHFGSPSTAREECRLFLPSLSKSWKTVQKLSETIEPQDSISRCSIFSQSTRTTWRCSCAVTNLLKRIFRIDSFTQLGHYFFSSPRLRHGNLITHKIRY